MAGFGGKVNGLAASRPAVSFTKTKKTKQVWVDTQNIFTNQTRHPLTRAGQIITREDSSAFLKIISKTARRTPCKPKDLLSTGGNNRLNRSKNQKVHENEIYPESNGTADLVQQPEHGRGHDGHGLHI
jgi:hypothetical protein